MAQDRRKGKKATAFGEHLINLTHMLIMSMRMGGENM